MLLQVGGRLMRSNLEITETVEQHQHVCLGVWDRCGKIRIQTWRHRTVTQTLLELGTKLTSPPPT
jgi:hypothetical protein